MVKKQDVLVARCRTCGEIEGWMRGGTCISELMFVSEMEKRICPCCEKKTIYTVRKTCRIKKSGEPYHVDMWKHVEDEPKPGCKAQGVDLQYFMRRKHAIA